MKLAESLSSVTKKLEEVKETTQELGETIKKSQPNTPQLAIENVTGTQSLRDTLAFMKKSNNFFKRTETKDGKVYWNGVRIKPVGDNKIKNNGKVYDITPCIQHYFTKTKSTTKSLNNDDKKQYIKSLKMLVSIIRDIKKTESIQTQRCSVRSSKSNT